MELVEKIERVGKVAGAIAATVGITIATGGWIFSAVMSDRDQQIEQLSRETRDLGGQIRELKSELRETHLRSEMSLDEIQDDVQDLQIALSALQVQIEFIARRAREEERSRPESFHEATPRAPSPRDHSGSASGESMSPRDASDAYRGAMERLTDRQRQRSASE